MSQRTWSTMECRRWMGALQLVVDRPSPDASLWFWRVLHGKRELAGGRELNQKKAKLCARRSAEKFLRLTGAP